MQQLISLRHFNGQPVAHVYGHTCQKREAERAGSGDSGAAGAVGSPLEWGQGAVVAFNLLRADGSWVGFR